MSRIVRNIARCKLCGDIVESKHAHDFVTCSCGNLSVDGGPDYQRRCVREGKDSFCELSPIYECGPGWWAMLDKELPEFYEVDPTISSVRVKEKFGKARIEFDVYDPNRIDLLSMHEEMLERLSSQTCEICGNYGKISNGKCRCDRCRNATRKELNEVMREVVSRYEFGQSDKER